MPNNLENNDSIIKKIVIENNGTYDQANIGTSAEYVDYNNTSVADTLDNIQQQLTRVIQQLTNNTEQITEMDETFGDARKVINKINLMQNQIEHLSQDIGNQVQKNINNTTFFTKNIIWQDNLERTLRSVLGNLINLPLQATNLRDWIEKISAMGGTGGGTPPPPVPDLYSLTTLHPAIVNIAGLEFDGTKYIDLNYVPKAGTKVDILFRQTAYQKLLFGSRTSDSSKDSFGFCAYSSQIYAQYGDSQGAVSYTMSLNDSHFLTISKNGAFLDGNRVKSFDSSQFVQSNIKMFLGSRNQNGTADSRMFTGMVYSMMIYENDSMIMALYPHNNGAVNGMYDIVGDNFYPLQ